MKRWALSVTLLASLNPLTGKAAMLNLPQSPLSLGNSVIPNVVFNLDDSGSMDWEFLTVPLWEECAYDPNDTGAFNAATTCGTQWSGDTGLNIYVPGRGYLLFNYVFNNSNNIYNTFNPTGCNSYYSFGMNSIQACTNPYNDWRVYSADLNIIYYDPSTTYTPWLYNCTSGTPCADANFSSAQSYPVQGTTDYGITKNLAGNKYEVWIDDKGFTGARPLRAAAVNATTTGNSIGDLWDSHVTVVLNSSNAQIYSTTYAPSTTGLNATQTLRATLTGSSCYNVLGPSALVQSIFNGSSSYTSTGATGCMTLAQARQNYANWYQYSRRRSMAARGAMAYVIDQYPNFNYGFTTINNAFFVQVPPSGTTNFTTYNNTLLNQLFSYDWGAQGTPLRSGLDNVGKYYAGTLSGTTNPITQSCQQNYTILMTDGYWNNPDSMSSYINDEDGDGIAKTLADVAYYYYKTDLSSLTNNVFPSALDPATWQHMVTFTMGFGLTGNLVAGTDGNPNPPLAIDGNWGNPFSDEAAKVDDLWHAAFNSTGQYFGAQNPALAGTALASVLGNIALRAVSSAPVAQNSSVLNTSSQVYQATFNSVDWSGDVLAFSLSPTGVLSTTASWSASCMLNGGTCTNPVGTNAGITPNNRVIITRNFSGANTGIPFRFPSDYRTYRVSGSYPPNLTALMANAPNSITTTNSSRIAANQAYGTALVNYLRGDHTYEDQNSTTYNFRDRTSELGDIIDSGPVYVPAPNRIYPDSLESSTYTAFKTANASRTPMVYAGANDGMLHGFDANTGEELLAYVPGARQIYQSLPALSQNSYTHKFYVDGPAVEGDVFYNGAWHTILVTTLGNGGQGISILDITDPSNFSEANASTIYVKEFTDLDDADLGYVIGAPIIAKVKVSSTQSKWAIILNNGYNDSQSDGAASSSGESALFVLLLENGINSGWSLNSSYYRMRVGTAGSVSSPIGLSTPYAVDIDSDYIVDYVYAGDLRGNMWKFDLTNSTPSSWTGSLLFAASNTTAGDQPITAPPVVTPHPNGIQNGVMVYFGTGKYLESTDNSATGQVTQSFYGIWDKLAGATVAKSALVQQSILAEVNVSNGSTTSSYRTMSNSAVNWNNPSQNLGCYFNFIVTGASSNFGERVVAPLIARNSNIIFTTMLPPTSVCAVGGSSWLMEVSNANCGAPAITVFDTNNDGVFNSTDYLTFTSGGTSTTGVAAGIKSTVGMTATPAIFLATDKSKETKVLSGATGLTAVSENPAVGPIGRQNWRQVN